jgi:hypothetical protein
MSAKFKSWLIQSIPLSIAFVAFFIIIVLCEISWAQDIAKNSPPGKHLGFYFSTGIASYREDLIVPLGFHGPCLSLGGIYTLQYENNLIHIRLKIGLGHLENRYSHEAWVFMQDIRLSWLKNLKEHQKYGKFWGGISLPFQMNNLFIESWDDAHLYWLTAYNLAGALQWEKKVSLNNHLSIRIEIPFLGWISRPPSYRYDKQEPLNHFTYHFTEPNKSLHFETINTYRNIFIQMLLKREVQRSLLNVGFEFQYNYCRKTERIFGLNTLLVFSYQWGIGR